MGADQETTDCCQGGICPPPGARVSDSATSLAPPGCPPRTDVSGGSEIQVARLQDTKDEVIHLRSAGVDLGKRFLLACVRTPSTPSTKRVGSWSLETERFGTTTAEVRRLLAWLMERQVEVVVMEATSDY
jgi:hypothetical protein